VGYNSVADNTGSSLFV